MRLIRNAGRPKCSFEKRNQIEPCVSLAQLITSGTDGALKLTSDFVTPTLLASSPSQNRLQKDVWPRSPALAHL
jgi:hypothetical protein